MTEDRKKPADSELKEDEGEVRLDDAEAVAGGFQQLPTELGPGVIIKIPLGNG